MTRIPRLYVPPAEHPGDRLELHGDAAHRLRDVLRLRQGDALRVFDGVGHEREASVAEVSSGPRGSVVLQLGPPCEPASEPPVPITLVCALPRGNRGDWLVEKATELGVAAIVPLDAQRSVLRAGEGRLDRWRRIATEAAEQCGRAVVPTLAGAVPDDALVLVADPSALRSVGEAIERAGHPSAVALDVGPEGGWADEERVAFREEGVQFVGLGPRTLRVETAALLGLAMVLDATGGLSPAG